MEVSRSWTASRWSRRSVTAAPRTAARASGSASASAGSAIAAASSHPHQRGLGALPRRGLGVGVLAEQQVAQIEVGMAERRLVHVEVDEARPAGRVLDTQAQLLDGLAPGRHRGRLAGVDVAAGLHPDPQALVPVQHRPAPADDDARRGDVRRRGVLVAGRVEDGELGQEALAGGHLTR